jgi:hypothetical protein
MNYPYFSLLILENESSTERQTIDWLWCASIRIENYKNAWSDADIAIESMGVESFKMPRSQSISSTITAIYIGRNTNQNTAVITFLE